MLEQLGPAVDAQLEYLQERARASYHPHAGQRGARRHWLSRRRHRTHPAAA
jgi:hypothetical protein